MFADVRVKIVNYSRGSPTVQSIIVKDEIWLDDNSLKYYKGVCNSCLQVSLYNYDRNFEQKEIFQQKGRHFKTSLNKLVQPLIYVWNPFLFIRTFRLPKKLLFIVVFFFFFYKKRLFHWSMVPQQTFNTWHNPFSGNKKHIKIGWKIKFLETRSSSLVFNLKDLIPS
jgi:hypothetical protein